MRVGFLNNQIDNRGTGNAVFDYAHYNETILGNESYIYSLNQAPPHEGMYLKLIRNFGPPNDFPISKLDVLYHIKSGFDDHFGPVAAGKYVVHSVFDNQPHGDVYAFISKWLGTTNGGPWVPHIISLDETRSDLRQELGLRSDDIVFGRHGGSNTFDISFCWDAINSATRTDSFLHFVFLNTDKPDMDLNDQVIFLPDTADAKIKRQFINTCDAMIHARARGETFGISVGEFDVAGKPILTYWDSPERAHLESAAYTYAYKDYEGLLLALLTAQNWIHSSLGISSGYRECTPEKVMKRFNDVFLEGSETA